ncbi:hypothetical protein HYH03_003252 [Edaphochlamys debaryana]|uniref:Phosphoglycerate mutase-like protein n=1 Tax=Edaphochlamys debaryana TaxID=47281 RepID=A0A835YJZ4_9CHLO|nr:hypothetical protein HYH03_003252 [Edaphochlamys debaryana]|eukprot:KAG2499069.1 hypothetical protein HYH03_003252 [Edaphochlamys debaryana]
MPPTNKVDDPADAEKTRLAVCPRISLLPARYTKTVHFVRHGQGFHNVAGHIDHELYKSEEYADAHLTELGWQQAEALGRHVASTRLPVDLVVVAPLQRALETAVAAFGRLAPADGAAGPGPGSNGNGANGNGANGANGNGYSAGANGPLLMAAQEAVPGKKAAHVAVWGGGCPPFVAHELCREHIGVHPCDRRSSVALYRERFPGVDFSLVQPDGDVLWTLEHRETKDEIRRRGLAFLKWLAARPERSIAVVTHSSFLHFTLGTFAHQAAQPVQAELHKWYENCEMRSVVLSDDSEEGAEAVGAVKDPWHFAGGAAAVGGDGGAAH